MLIGGSIQLLLLYICSVCISSVANGHSLWDNALNSASNLTHFQYDGKPSYLLLPHWPSSRHCDGTVCTTEWADPSSGLVVRLNLTTFSPYASWWVMEFINNGTVATGIISDVKPLNIDVPLQGADPTTLRYSGGSDAKANDFQPQQVKILDGAHQTLPPELATKPAGWVCCTGRLDWPSRAGGVLSE